MSLEAWPLNTSGKIDRKRLPEVKASAAGQHLAPRTSAEQWVADAVVEVLQVMPESVENDLLRAGLTSLMAVWLSSLLIQRH